MKPRRGKPADRAGYALVLFVMMFFGLMGLAALVIDMGFARLAQRQMQTAVDSAALEGLRFRDDIPSDWYTPGNPTYDAIVAACGACPESTYDPSNSQWQAWIDKARRWAASQMVANMFSDYVDSSGKTVHYGAGPVVNFSGGIDPTELAASQLMQPGSPPVYQPAGLALNATGNAQEGDMVAGTYGSNLAYSQQNPMSSADEDDNYNRRDFQNTSNQAFLVRMRRTPLSNVPGSLDNAPGVSSGGPTLPLLFGRGGLMARSGSSDQLSVTSGITVRAAAIAAAGPAAGLGQTPYEVGRAKAAGPPYQGTDANNNPVNIPGTTPFSITVGAWNSMPANVPEAFQSSGGSGDVQWFGNSPTNVIQIGQSVSVMGGTSTTLAIGGVAGTPTQSGYVPIYAVVPLGGQSSTIIGFGYVRWNWDAASGTLTLTKGSTGTYPVGCGNVSGVLVLALPASFSQQDVATLFQLHAGAATDPSLAPDNLTNSVYAPVLVNRYIGPNQSNP
jgi:Tfp pilus assembly protein PilV